MTDERWAALDYRPPGYEAWRRSREAAGLRHADLMPMYLQAYLDDYLGVALSQRAADAQCDLVVGILSKLKFPLKPEKTVRPAKAMEALGAGVTACVSCSQCAVVFCQRPISPRSPLLSASSALHRSSLASSSLASSARPASNSDR